MVERDFEAQLERMFNQAPVLADNDAFTRRVTGKLNRNWRLRAVGIASAGAIGGVIAVSQLIGSGLSVRLSEAEERTEQAATGLFADALSAMPPLDIGGYDMGANLFWIVSAMLVLVAGAFSTRLFDEA